MANLNIGKINYFTVIIILLFLGACILEIKSRNLKMALYYFFSASITFVVSMMKG